MSKILPHQKEALLRINALSGKAGVFVGLGGGKTRIALANSRLRSHRRVLVVVPTYVGPVWELEAEKIDFALDVHNLVGGEVARRTKFVKDLKKGDGLILTNYEAYWKEPFRSALRNWEPEAIILDEAHRIRNRGSRQSRFAHTFEDKGWVDTRLALTGTPATNGLQDIWSIARFIRKDVFGTWNEFEARYIVSGFFPGQIIDYRNEGEAKTKLSSISYQWEGEAPIAEDITIPVTLSPATRKAYDELKALSLARVHSLEGTEHVAIADIALTLLLRLHQIGTGFVKDENGSLVRLGMEKVDTTIGLLEDLHLQGKKTVVFCRYLDNLDQLEAKMPPHIAYARIDGSVPIEHRKDLLKRFDTGGDLDVLICQIRSTSLGIDLSAANVAIFFSTGHSLDDFMQAKGRLTGALRQRHPVVFYHIVASRTVDEGIYDALMAKTVIARRITDLSYALALLGGNSSTKKG